MKWLHRYGFTLIAIFILGFHLILVLNTQFTAWPELLVYSHLLQNGFGYFGDIVQPYFPTLPYFLSLMYKFLGLSVLTLRLVTCVLILTIDLILLLILFRETNRNKFLTFFGGTIYVLVQTLFEGNGLWFDLATVPFLLVAYIFLRLFLKRKIRFYLFLCGLFIGTAFAIKQTAIWFFVFLVLFFSIKKGWKGIIYFSIGFLLPFFVLHLFFPASSIWYWDIYYPFIVMSKSTGYAIYPTLRQLAVTVFVFSPVFLAFLTEKKKPEVLLWIAAGMMFVFPRFAYFHIQPALPFFIIYLVYLLNNINFKNRKQIMVIYLFGVGLLLVKLNPSNSAAVVRFFEPQVYEEAQSLRKIVPENSTVFFYNDMGNVMVASKFVPPKPWAYNFPWYMDIPGLQEKIIEGMKFQDTKFIIYSPLGNEGERIPGSYKPKLLHSYIMNNFEEISSTETFKIFRQRN